MIKKKVEENVTISIPEIDKRSVVIRVVGTSPLIVHKWSEKAKKEILDKQTGKAKTKKHDLKDPFRDFMESLYWLDGIPDEFTEEAFNEAIENGARFGFPSVAFKAAAVSAGYRAGATKNLVSMRAAFHINSEFVEIKSLDGQMVPEMREDMVRVGMGTADIRYRGQFSNWYAEIPVVYNAGAVTLEQLVNLFNLGGYSCGVGEWRVEKGGNYGSFEVRSN